MLFVMILAALRAAFAVLALAMLAMLLWGLITQPRRTVVVLAMLVLINVANLYPLVTLGLAALLLIAAMAVKVSRVKGGNP